MNDMLLVVVLAGRRAVLPAVAVNSVIELAEVTPERAGRASPPAGSRPKPARCRISTSPR